MKKCINYLVFLVLLLFIGCYKVDADSIGFSCKYSNGNKDVYLYCTDNKKDKCRAIYVTKDGNKYEFVTKTVKDVVFGKNNTCPSYANKDSYILGIGYKAFKFGKGSVGKDFSLVDEDYTGKYTPWSLNDSGTNSSFGNYSYSINFNEFGFLTYSGSIDSVIINGFNGSKPTFNSKLFTEKGKFEFDTKNSGSTGDGSGSGSNSGSSGSNSGSSGSNSGSSGSLGVGGYCVYRNIGICAGNDGNINGDCPGVYTGTLEKSSHYFIRAKYAVLKYNTMDGVDSFDNVYLPKYIDSNNAFIIDPNVTSRVVSNYNAFDGSISKLETLLKDFAVFSKNNVSSLNSINYSSEKKNGCPVWISDIDGAGGHDYEDAQYFYQYYNTNEEDNDRGEDAGIADSGTIIDPGEGPYYCIYDGEYGTNSIKRGSLALFYDPDSSRLKLISYDFDQAYLNTACALSDCATADGVKFVGYGGYESNDGSFQSNFVSASTGTCPRQINFNYSNNLLTICKDDSDECLNGQGGVFGKINRFSNSFGKASNSSTVTINDCTDLINEDLRKLLNKYFNLFRILIPIILIVLGIVDFTRATVASKEDEMKKAQSAFVKRLIVCVIVFLIPTFVNLLLDVANTVWGWNAGTCDIENVDNE